MAKKNGTSPPEDSPRGVADLILHNVKKGVTRLLSEPRDLPEAWPRPDQPVRPADATPSHRELFGEYERELAAVIKVALEWWKGRLNKMQQREGVGRKQALNLLYQETLAGPASAPQVVWVVRTFWLSCEELNELLPIPDRVPPEVFLIGWLTDGRHPGAVQVLSGMLYWPIGLDPDGNWV